MVELYLTKVEAFVRKSPDCWFVTVKIGWLGWLTQDGVCPGGGRTRSRAPSFCMT